MSRRIHRRDVMERTIRKQRRRLSHYVRFEARVYVAPDDDDRQPVPVGA